MVRSALKAGSATRISGTATATRTRSWLYRLRNGRPVGIVRPLPIGAYPEKLLRCVVGTAPRHGHSDNGTWSGASCLAVTLPDSLAPCLTSVPGEVRPDYCRPFEIGSMVSTR